MTATRKLHDNAGNVPEKTITFNFSVEPTGPENTEEQQVLRVEINKVYEWVGTGVSPDVIASQATKVEEMIGRFSGIGHATPQWAIENARGNAKYALYVAGGQRDRRLFDEALGHQERSAEVAGNDSQLAKSMNNLCDFYRRENRLREAIMAGWAAHKLWPGNEGAIVNLAVALHQAGQKEQASRILKNLLDTTGTEGTVLGAHARFEHDLKTMTDLPVVRQLLSIENPNNNR